MKVTLLTYDCPHRKTQDVLGRMIRADRFSIDLALVPFKPRPEREVAFRHRPFQFEGPDAAALANQYGLKVSNFADWRTEARPDYFVVCGANLLEAEFCLSNKVVNCHAGLIPLTRGLDSFKWSILKGNPVGNTLHLIDDKVDHGEVLHHHMTEEYASDDLQTFADRHYLNEIDLLANFDRYLPRGNVMRLSIEDPTMRMPIEIEREMVRSFEAHKDKFALAGAIH